MNFYSVHYIVTKSDRNVKIICQRICEQYGHFSVSTAGLWKHNLIYLLGIKAWLAYIGFFGVLTFIVYTDNECFFECLGDNH